MGQYDSIRPLYASSGRLWDELIDSRKGYLMDIGAHTGGYASTWASRCSRIDCFEPVKAYFDVAKKLEAVYPNVHVHQLAMSDTVGLQKNMNVFHSCSLLPDDVNLSDMKFWFGKAKDFAKTEPFDFETTTIDQWAEDHGLLPDLIKIDVDGYELKVMRGAVKTLTDNPCPIMFEYSYLPKFLGDSIEEMATLIYELGYRAWSWDGSYVAQDAKAFLACYPHDTSYDVVLIHASQK